MANKASGAVLKFLQNIGSKGGTSRAKKYDAKTRSAWSGMGGRPPVYSYIVSTPDKEHTFRTQIDARKFATELRRKFIQSVVLEKKGKKRNERHFIVSVSGAPKQTFETLISAKEFATALRRKLLSGIKKSRKAIK